MSTTTRLAVATLGAVAVVTIAVLRPTPSPREATPPTGATVSAPVAPAVRERAPRAPSALAAARRALRWQRAAEAGRVRRLPVGTFTDQLAAELATRPPRPAPSSSRARLAGVREQSPVGGVRRVLATVQRAGRVEHVSLLVACRPNCRVASIE